MYGLCRKTFAHEMSLVAHRQRTSAVTTVTSARRAAPLFWRRRWQSTAERTTLTNREACARASFSNHRTYAVTCSFTPAKSRMRVPSVSAGWPTLAPCARTSSPHTPLTTDMSVTSAAAGSVPAESYASTWGAMTLTVRQQSLSAACAASSACRRVGCECTCARTLGRNPSRTPCVAGGFHATAH